MAALRQGLRGMGCRARLRCPMALRVRSTVQCCAVLRITWDLLHVTKLVCVHVRLARLPQPFPISVPHTA
eukprot:2996459-Rhodomonas_salina.2